MKYQSPIRLFEYCAVDHSITDINRIKKIISAEFSLSESGIICVEGFDYSKNDLFEELEKDDFIQRMEYHKLIWEKNSLLKFLENNTLIISMAKQQWLYLKDSEDFVKFVSPYFSHAFNKAISKMLVINSTSISGVNKILDFQIFIMPEDEHDAFQGLSLYLNNGISLFKNNSSYTYWSRKNEFDNWLNEPWGELMNKIPSYYQVKIQELAMTITSFIGESLSTQKIPINTLYSLSTELNKINNIGAEGKEVISKNHEIISAAYNNILDSQDNSDPGTEFSFPWKTILFIIFIIIKIIVLFSRR